MTNETKKKSVDATKIKILFKIDIMMPIVDELTFIFVLSCR